MGNLVAFVVAWIVFITLTAGLGLLLVPVYWAFVFRNSGGRVKKAEEKLSSTLMDNESLIGSALQMRISSLMSRRLLLGITTSRIIQINRPLFGGFSMTDRQWKDLRDAKLAENIMPGWFGSRLTFKFEDSNVEINGITNDSASRIYKEAQQQEQDWEEKRRVRELEEVRAASGATLVNTGGAAAGGSGADASLDEITKAKQMLESGVISDAEFSEIKAKILSRGQF
jgi:hypothetical protein